MRIIGTSGLLGSVAAFLLGSASAMAQVAPGPLAPADRQIEALRPGGYLWTPQIAPAGPVIIIISLKTQRACAYRNGCRSASPPPRRRC